MSENWTILKLIKWTTDYLLGKGVATPRLDAELLLAHVLEMDRTHLYMNFDKAVIKTELSAFRELVKRRAKREPLQYITGCQEFWSKKLMVDPFVLIPRPETELLVEEGIREVGRSFAEEDTIEILDVGTGSGALAIALASEFKNAGVTAVENSHKAVIMARKNIEAQFPPLAVTVTEGDLFEKLGDKSFHMIVSNPPYIPTGELESLQPEVRDYEPVSALDGGVDGLDYFRRIIPGSLDHLKPGGWLMLEHGEGQSDEVQEIFNSTGSYEPIEAVRDLSGIFRVVKGRRAL